MTIPQEIQEAILTKPRQRILDFSIESQDFLKQYAIKYKYPVEYSMKNVYMLIKNNITKIPKCDLKGCKQKRIINNSNRLTEGCCPEHTRQIRNLKKYGVTNVSHLQSNKDKIKATCLKNNGSEFPMQSEEIRKKHKVTCMNRYGVENVSSLQVTQEKVNKTNMERYGVNRPTQSARFLLKGQSYKLKEYKWKTGQISMLQGYEPIVLKELEEQGIKYEDIISDIDKIPMIKYELNGVNHNYYPDFYIPKENLIIEVKSAYTLQKNWDKNQAKFEATRNAGYNFKLEVR